MVSKFTSRNRTALFRTNSFRWASTYLFLIALIFGGVSNAYAQPTFTQCDPSNVTLQPGGANLVLDNITIPAFLSIDAVASAGTVTYTAVPGLLECSDIGGGPVTVTITATDDNGSSTCVTNVTVSDGGPAAACMALTQQLTGGTVTVAAADFDGGSTACTAVTPTGISRDGGVTFFPTLTFTCADLMMSPIDIELQVTDSDVLTGPSTATCMTTLTLEDEAPTAMCSPFTLMLDASGNATLTVPDVDNGSTIGACMGGMLSLSQTAFTCADITTATNPAVVVTLTSTNASGQTATCPASITVQDAAMPMAMCAPITIQLTAANIDAMGNYTLTAADLAALSAGTTDNCTFTTTVSQTTFSCADVGSPVNVTVTVTDPAGNMDTCPTVVTITDATDPVLVDCPMGDIATTTSVMMTGNCYGLPTFTNPTVTESCPAATPLTVAYTAGMPAPTFALPTDGAATAGAANTTEFPVGQTIVTFTATDASGLTNTCSFTVTVTDDEVPTFTNCPLDISVNVDPNECDQTVSVVPPTPMDNCGGTGLITSVVVSDPNVVLNNTAPGGALGDPNGVDFADFPIGTTILSYSFRDASGNQIPNANVCEVRVTVIDNIPPSIACPPNQTLAFGSCNPAATVVPDYIGLSSATDNCPTNNVVQVPPAGTPITTLLGATPMDGQSFNVTITISDSQTSNNCTFSVTMDDNNMPVPNQNPLSTLTFDCGNALVEAPYARDNCGNLIYGVPNQGTPAGTGPPLSNINPPIVFDISTLPGVLTDSIPDDNPAAPLVVSLPVSGLDPELSDFSLGIEITHTWVGDINLSITAPNGGGTVNVFNRPGQPGSFFGCFNDDINATFSDDAAQSAADFENLCVPGMAGNFMPIDLFSQFDGINPNGNWIITVSDNGGGDTGTLDNVSLNITTLGTIPRPLYEYTPGNYTVQWSYTDVNNVVVNQLQQINVVPDTEVPMINCSPITLELDQNGQAVLAAGTVVGEMLQINGSDAGLGCSGTFPFVCPESAEFCITVTSAETVGFNWDFFSNDAFGPAFDPFGYSLNGTFVQLTNTTDNPQSGRTEVALVAGDQFCFSAATDDGGFGGSETTITNFTPGFTGAFDVANWTSNEATLAFGGTIDYTSFDPNSITDNCGVDISSLTVNGANNFAFDCTNIGVNSVTINVSDINGNPATCNANITVVDNFLPALVNIPTGPINVSCEMGADTTGLNVFAVDNCSSPSITFNTVTTQTGNPALCTFYDYTVRNIYTATDNQGNQDVQFYDVFVSDTEEPVFDANLATTEMLSVGQSCTATAAISLTATDVTDNCADFSVLDLNYTVRDGNGVIIGSGTGNASVSLSPGSYSITYNAVDPCGNTSANFVRSYTVVDDTAPFAICNAGPFTIGLPTSGSITIAGQLMNTIDNNSFDNCNPIIRTVTRMDGSPAVFTCADVTGSPIGVLLTVTDAVNGSSNSCSSSVIIEDNIAPQIICQNLTVSLDANGQANITPAMVNNGSFDACTALDPASLTLDRTMFDIADVGQTIPVTLTGADNSGNSSSCTAMITITPPPTCFQVGQQLGGAGDIISIPVTVSDFVNVASFQFTLEITNTDVADFAGTSGINPAIQTDFLTQLMATDTFISNIDSMIVMDINGMDSVVYDTTLANSFDQMAVSFVTANIPANLNDNDIAFFIDVILTGDLNTFSSIIDIPNAIVTPAEIVYEFGNNTAQPTLIPTVPCLNPNGPGAFGISQLVIAGQVNNENGLPVNLVDVDLSDLRQPLAPIVTDDQTGPDGTYRLIVSSNSDYRIIPSKNIRWDNGIDIEDVAAIQRHAVGNVFLNSAYKKIAADVSNDGRVTGFDATLLNNYLSTALLGTPPSTNTSWRFVDAAQILPNTPDAFLPAFSETITIIDIRTDSLSNNFIGVKIGDVAGAIADPQVLTEDGDSRSEDDLIFTLKDEAIVAGEVYNLTLNARNFEQLIGYQFILNFDPQVLRYLGTETIELDGNAKVGTTLTDQGQLVLTWYNGAPTTEAIEAALFDLSFEAIRNAGTIQSLLSIAELENFKAVAYNEASEALDIQLEFVQPVFAKDYQLYQNTPNPFRGETVIGFDLPSEATGTLDIMDVSGKVIKSYADTYQKGYNQITVTASELPAVGVLYYQLKTDDFTATKKMILID